jgi:hypothetical protein
MTKAKISEYDAVASNNTDVNGVNIAENCPPSGMNNMGREIMAALKRFQTGSDGDGVTVGGNLVVSGSSTLATTAISSADINGGTIDGTAVGGASAAAGAFTTLNTSGAVVFNDAGADVDFRVEGDTDANLLFVDASTNSVGIGTSSPVSKLHLLDNSAVFIQMTDSGDGASRIGQNGTALTFGVDLANGATERMRIDSSGNVGVGTTGPSGYAPFTVAKAAFNVNIGQICAASLSASDAGITGMSVWKTDATTSASQIFIKFIIDNGNSGSGQINADGANQAAFGSYSDRRLKENIVGLEAQLANICALRPVEFDYIKSEGGGHQVGFVAQEMQEVYPDAVGERQPDGMLTVTGWSKTEARLVKAIQELNAKVEALQSEIATLKGN